MPKVSVIIPNYNHARFLAQRIQSVLDQTYQDFEILYLDDASTDNSNEVAARFQTDSRIRFILNQTNSGSPFKQWNKGIKAATGEYIWIAESDDFADSTFLATLVPILEEHPEVGVAYCQSCQVDENSSPICQMTWWTDDLDPARWLSDFINHGVDECRDYLIFKNTIPNASAVLVRRYLFDVIGYAEENMRLCGDWLTWIKLLLQSDIAFVAKPLNYYRTHSTTVRSQSKTIGLETFERMRFFATVKDQVSASKALEEKIKNHLVNDWIVLFFARSKPLSLKDNLRLYQIAKSYDPLIELRFLKQAAIYVSAKFQDKVGTLLSVKTA